MADLSRKANAEHSKQAASGKLTGLTREKVLVAKSKTMLVLNLRAFIPSGKFDFATSTHFGHQPWNAQHLPSR